MSFVSRAIKFVSRPPRTQWRSVSNIVTPSAAKLKTYKVSAVGDKVTTHLSYSGDKSTDANQSWTLDEPKWLGGTDVGPTPLHALLGALCGCANATAWVIARQMKLPVESFRWEAEGVLDVRGMKGEEGFGANFQKVLLKASVKTKEPAERLAELKDRVESRCPVSALVQRANIEYEVVFDKVDH